MASWWRVLACGFACFVCVNALNNTNSTGSHQATAVVLDNEQNFAVCVYPRSVSSHSSSPFPGTVTDSVETGYLLLPLTPPLLLHPSILPLLSRPPLARRRCSRLCSRLLRLSSRPHLSPRLARSQSLHRKRQLGPLRHLECRLPHHRAPVELVGNIAPAWAESSEFERSKGTEDEW